MPNGETLSRELTFQEGSSNKFWKIELDGSSHTVQYGRVGTNGQTQTKTFDSAAEAKKSFDKLVAEKLKKGYVDSGSNSSSTEPKTELATATKSASQAISKTTTKAPNSASPQKTAAQSKAIANDSVDLNVTHQIDIDPADYLLAGPRFRPRLHPTAPRQFDREDCVAQIAKLKTKSYGWDMCWESLRIPDYLSREEAHFWFIAATKNRGRETTMKTFSQWMAKAEVTGNITIEQVRGALHQVERGLPSFAGLALAHLLSVEDYVGLLLEPPVTSHRSGAENSLTKGLIDGFTQHVIPRLSDQQQAELRARVMQSWTTSHTPAHHYSMLPIEYYLAAGLGMHEHAYQITSGWESGRYQKTPWLAYYEHPYDLVYALETPELVASEWRRLHLPIRSPLELRTFLAATGTLALDFACARIGAETNKDECEGLLKVFSLVRCPEVAPYMLELKLSCKTPALARDWLEKYVGISVAGLVPVAAGRGKLSEAAIEYLRGVKRRGYASLIESALESNTLPEQIARIRDEVLDYEEKVYESLDDSSTPAELLAEFQKLELPKPKRLPSWATGDQLPPLLIGDRRLNDSQVAQLLQLFASTELSQKHPLFVALRAQVKDHIRDAFAWQLFQNWLGDGCPSKDKWAMAAIGQLGADGCVMKLTPLIRVWPGESQHARAVLGLECLRAIGSSLALMQLSGIAQKLKFKALQAKAQLFVNEIAQERGLSRDELEDRVVPDCGLDENGRRVFSYGVRSFSFVLDSDLKAMVRDENGKVRPNLPDPNSKDDAALAEQSQAEWKLLKKQVKEVATIQAGRLEQAMITGRRWSPGDFLSLLVQHPLMTHLVQKLIWAGYASDGSKRLTFRITEERDLADGDDNTVILEDCTSIGIVHPLDLSDAERARWGEVLSDYELVAPFPQIGRAVHGLEAGEVASESLSRFNGLKLVAPTLVFTLEKQGWIRGTAMDGGCFDEHSKQFPASNVTAVINYDGSVGMGYIDPNEILTLTNVFFCAGMREPSGYDWNSGTKLPLGSVSPVVLSEVISDLNVLKSKAK